tara:strand:- start:2694 stop:3113 length:420 start_codon:yes stop_codon:yes gene_type:complete
MEFCEKCDNLLTLAKEKGTDTLHYHCKACNSKRQCPADYNPCVLKKTYGGNAKVFYELFINEYTKYDPTLPHLNNTPCQNAECAKKTSENGEESNIVYVRYSEEKMKYIYLCCKCDKAWIHPEYQKVSFIQDGEISEKN